MCGITLPRITRIIAASDSFALRSAASQSKKRRSSAKLQITTAEKIEIESIMLSLPLEVFAEDDRASIKIADGANFRSAHITAQVVSEQISGRYREVVSRQKKAGAPLNTVRELIVLNWHRQAYNAALPVVVTDERTL